MGASHSGGLSAAVFPAIVGVISDVANIQRAFYFPVVCHLYVLYFALRGYKSPLIAPSAVVLDEVPTTLHSHLVHKGDTWNQRNSSAAF